MDQWIAQLSIFLNIDPKAIGRIGGGKSKPGYMLDVAMIQSLTRRGEEDGLFEKYGHVIVDECHHVPAVSFERVMRRLRAKYVTGLTATPYRRDGHHPILKFNIGPIRFSVDSRKQADDHSFEHRVIPRETAFRLEPYDRGAGIQEIYRLLAMDEERNIMILEDVIGALEEGRSPILLTERRDHLDIIYQRLHGFARNIIVLRGGMGRKQRREATERLAGIPDGEERVILATGRFIGEGFDDARLDTLFLAMPVSWKGTLIQYAGRLHRNHESKREVRIFDYVDSNVPMLKRMFEKRMRGYRSMGYS